MNKRHSIRFVYALIAFLCINFGQKASAQVQTLRSNTSMITNSKGFIEYLPQGYSSSGTATYPLLIFIHGIGELGDGSALNLPKVMRNGPPLLINKGTFPVSFTVNNQTFKFIVLSPQFVKWPTAADINGVISYALSHYKVDASRIYLTGFSMGGGAVWATASDVALYNKRIAAIVPMAGAYSATTARANVIADANIPVWAVHNDQDPTVPVAYTNNFVAYIKARNPSLPVKKTIYSSTSHNCWSRTYVPTYRENGLNVYEWMLQFKKGTVPSSAPATNQPPVANAGSDKTITLPTSSITLSGSGSDADGSISKYSWTKTAGPSGAVIGSPSSASTSVTGLVQGSYTFRLTVTDNGGATAYNDVNVTVNAAINKMPEVDAGESKTIILPMDSVLLHANATDSDGTIAAYTWRKITGPDSFNIISPSQSTTLIKSLVYGTYNFEIKVTDDKGGVAKDTVWIKVDTLGGRLNIAPAAYAGPDQQINLPVNTVLLSGSGKDADGEIKTYQWKKIKGPQSGTIVDFAAAQTEVRSLVQGVYLFELTVTDNDSANASDTVEITVNVQVVSKKPPVANAGADITIIPPVDSVILDGHATDADGYITAYSWRKISGPALFTITDVSKAKTKVTNLAPGIYKFELKVTDNDGLVAKDTVSVTVDASFSKLNLTVNAGEDKILYLPKDSVQVECIADDPFGLITGYSWKKVSGPNQYKIDSASISKTTIGGLKTGIYQFECSVLDKYNNVVKDTVQITVRNLVNSKASVYPNPAVNKITLKIEANTVANQTKICIYNQYGQQVYSESFMRTSATIEKQIDVSFLVKGVYFIETGVDINNKVTLKLIKQ